jgi:diacylglycerol kinase
MLKIKRLIRSFNHAVDGLRCALREQNFQIELLAALVALALAVCFNIPKWELSVLIIIILLVLILEIINTIFERVIDILVPRQHPYAKTIKDMMAGAVLLACLGSLLIGFIVFLPHFGNLFHIF